jgi:hypothetical protein
MWGLGDGDERSRLPSSGKASLPDCWIEIWATKVADSCLHGSGEADHNHREHMY